MAQGWKGNGQTEPDKEWYGRIIARAARPVIVTAVTTALGVTMANHPPRRGNARLGRSYNGLFLQAAPVVLGMLPLMIVKAYRAKRPEFGPMGACRCNPTCSTYAEAIFENEDIDTLRGCGLVTRRIIHCRTADPAPEP